MGQRGDPSTIRLIARFHEAIGAPERPQLDSAVLPAARKHTAMQPHAHDRPASVVERTQARVRV